MPTSIQIYFLVWNLVIAVMFFLLGARKGGLGRHHHDPLPAVAWCESLGKESLQAGCVCTFSPWFCLEKTCFLHASLLCFHAKSWKPTASVKTLQDNVCSCVCSSWILSLFGTCYKMKNYDFNKEKPDPFLELLNLVNWEGFWWPTWGTPVRWCVDSRAIILDPFGFQTITNQEDPMSNAVLKTMEVLWICRWGGWMEIL